MAEQFISVSVSLHYTCCCAASIGSPSVYMLINATVLVAMTTLWKETVFGGTLYIVYRLTAVVKTGDVTS